MFIRLEPSSGVPIKRQIADQVRLACATGGLVAGDRLPSVRELARQLAVNQNTVLRVYEQLTAEGLLDRRHGEGTYMANGQHASDSRGGLRDQQMRILRNELQRVARRATELGVSRAELKKLIDETLKEHETEDRTQRRRGTKEE